MVIFATGAIQTGVIGDAQHWISVTKKNESMLFKTFPIEGKGLSLKFEFWFLHQAPSKLQA